MKFSTQQKKYSKLVFLLCIAALHHFDHDHKENPIPIFPSIKKRVESRKQSNMLHFLVFGFWFFFFFLGFLIFPFFMNPATYPKRKKMKMKI
jgi:hypothetical protein